MLRITGDRYFYHHGTHDHFVGKLGVILPPKRVSRDGPDKECYPYIGIVHLMRLREVVQHLVLG